jgi:CYTH domain-containing protein
VGYKEEIERKFLVKIAKLPKLPTPFQLKQGYLSYSPTVRVRTQVGPSENERQAYLTIKGPGIVGRDEFEYSIPPEEAEQLLKLSKGSVISKKRYNLPVQGQPDLKWELDIFEGDNEGLIVAELEIPDEYTKFEKPEWLGTEVTEDGSYKNAMLAQNPFMNWSYNKQKRS